MPPNPDRQAKLAARREQMANDPALKDAADAASAAVLGSYEQPQARQITPDAPAPKPMLPNYYKGGGKVKRYDSGGKVDPLDAAVTKASPYPGTSPRTRPSELGTRDLRGAGAASDADLDDSAASNISGEVAKRRNAGPPSKLFGIFQPDRSFAAGGVISKGNPFASGGPVLPRSGGQHAKNATKR